MLRRDKNSLKSRDIIQVDMSTGQSCLLTRVDRATGGLGQVGGWHISPRSATACTPPHLCCHLDMCNAPFLKYNAVFCACIVCIIRIFRRILYIAQSCKKTDFAGYKHVFFQWVYHAPLIFAVNISDALHQVAFSLSPCTLPSLLPLSLSCPPAVWWRMRRAQKTSFVIHRLLPRVVKAILSDLPHTSTQNLLEKGSRWHWWRRDLFYSDGS